ncbi:MAG: YbaY family lipoprotein [Acidobacteriota bacterium]
MRTEPLRPRLALALITMLVTAGGAGLGEAGEAIRGTAMYRERIALPPNAIFEASLENVSRADARAEVIGRARIESPRVPIRFEIPYDSASIDERNAYAVRASIRIGGDLRFTTDTVYPVLTRGAGNEVEILLRSVGGGRGGMASPLGKLPAAFTGDLPCADCEGIRYQLDLVSDSAYFLRTSYIGRGGDAVFDRIGSWSTVSGAEKIVLWDDAGPAEQFQIVDPSTLRKLNREGLPIESVLNYDLTRVADGPALVPQLAMRGMYRSHVTGVEITECQTGLELLVAAEGDAKALEKAASHALEDERSSVLVSFEGRIELRPVAEGGGVRRVVVVEQFDGAWPRETCGARGVVSELEASRWVPTRIAGQPVGLGVGGREAFIVLQPEGHRVTGFSGCNQLVGRYEIEGTSLRFSGVAKTGKACLQGMETEAAFTSALERTRSFRLYSQHLELLDRSGAVLARLESRNLG